MEKSVIAIVGRPNVGKSTLFNALLGERLAIVDDSPGITRDRLYADGEWYGKHFALVDTGGLEPDSKDEMLQSMRQQAEYAIEAAEVIIFVCDLTTGPTAADREIAMILRKSQKPVLLAVNKADHPGNIPPDAYEFYQLGLGEIYPVSASHRRGLGELMEAAIEFIPSEPKKVDDSDRRIRVAIIGKPNVGKSSLLNYLVGESRAIVSPIAGTTRDALDVDLDTDEGKFRLIDTAGLRRKSKVDTAIEKYSIIRTRNAIERADVCLIMIDAAEGITEQDTKVAGLANQAGKASIFLINKWDLVEKDEKTMEQFRARLTDSFPFMRYAPSLFISVVSGQRIPKLFGMIKEVDAEAGRRPATAVLNEVLAEAVALHAPPQDKGRHLRIYYMTQVASRPPQFVFFINDRKLLHFSYERYLENQLRMAFGFAGTPLKFIWREKQKAEDERTPKETHETPAAETKGRNKKR